MKKETTYKIVVSGLLIAISVILTRVFSFTFPVLNFPASRLSIGYLPIILAGVMLGPAWGFSVGALADVIGFAFSGVGMVYSPLITLVSALVGLLSWLLYCIPTRGHRAVKVSGTVTLTLIACSMFLQTFAISFLYGIPFWVLFASRLPVVLVSIPVYCLLVYYIIQGLEKAKLIPKKSPVEKVVKAR